MHGGGVQYSSGSTHLGMNLQWLSAGVIGEEDEGSKFGISGVHGEEPGNVYVNNCICIIFWVCILMFEKILVSC